MFEKLKKFFYYKILHKNYWRTGKCKGCGQCCTHIYVKHFKHVLQDEKEFKRLQFLHKFYSDLEIIGKDELGLIFECKNLDKETKKCKNHFFRPGICRRYPQEELFAMGGTLSETCGYKMEPIVPFKDVLNEVNKKSNKKNVEIISPIELNFETKSNVLFKLEHKLNCEVVPRWTVDEDIIAGLTFKFDDYVIDTSIRNKIENLSKNISR